MDTSSELRTTSDICTAADALVASGDLDQAATLYSRILANESHHYQALIATADIQLKQGLLDKAWATINCTESIYPENDWVLILKGKIAALRGDRALAVRSFEKACAVTPGCATPRLLLAEFLYSIEDSESADGHVLAAELLEPRNYWAKLAVAHIHGKAGRVSAADEKYRSAIDIDPNAPQAYESAAGYYRSVGLFEKAAETVLRALELNVRVSMNTTDLAGDLLSLKRYDEVLNLLLRLKSPIADLRKQGVQSAQFLISIARIAPDDLRAIHCLERWLALSLQDSAQDYSSDRIVSYLLIAWVFGRAARETSEPSIDSLALLTAVTARILARGPITFLSAISELYATPDPFRSRVVQELAQLLAPFLSNAALPPQYQQAGAIVAAYFRQHLIGFPCEEIAKILTDRFETLTFDDLYFAIGNNHFIRDSNPSELAILLWQKTRASRELVRDPSAALKHLLLAQFASREERARLHVQLVHQVSLDMLVTASDSETESRNQGQARLLACCLAARSPTPPVQTNSPEFSTALDLVRSARYAPKRTVRAPLLRIAFCVSGQMREVSSVVPTWHQTLNADPTTTFDIFVHTWRKQRSTILEAAHFRELFPIETAQQLEEYVLLHSYERLWHAYPSLRKLLSRTALDCTHDSLAEVYATSPERVVIEDDEEHPFSAMSNQEKMLYKIRSCQQLCEDSGIHYDMIVRIRPDLKLIPSKDFSWQSVFELVQNSPLVCTDCPRQVMADGGVFFMGDQFAVGNPSTMSIYSRTGEISSAMRSARIHGWPQHDAGHVTMGWVTWLMDIETAAPPNLGLRLQRNLEALDFEAVEAALQSDALERMSDYDVKLLASITRARQDRDKVRTTGCPTENPCA